MMVRAHFKYSVWHIPNNRWIVIEDIRPSKEVPSVTSDIENVIEWVAAKENINPVEFNIIYKDSKGIWDGYVFSTRRFVILNARSIGEATDKFLLENKNL